MSPRSQELEVSLRPVEPEDLPIFFAHQSDPVANEMAAFPARDHEAFHKHWAKIMRADESVIRTIIAGGRVAGNIGSWGPPNERGVGYWIGREYWGRGVATAALAAFLSIDTSRPMIAHVVVDNRASIRVLEKCGFEISGEATSPTDGVKELIFELRGDSEATL
jgi:RimJ/RimL family protein N-acetyltransferase